GRLERPDLVERVIPLLGDEEPLVRAEAAHALAQAVHRADAGSPEVRRARETVLSHLSDSAVTTESGMRGVLLRSLGRLPVADSGVVVQVAGALVEFSLGTADSLGVRGD